MRPQSKQAKTLQAATGIFALLRGLSRARGTGAQKIRFTVTTTQKLALTALTVGSAGVLALPVAAQAANGHGFTSTFGSETSTVKDSEPLSGPTAVAWSAKTNEIYVLDTGHERVERFSASGKYEGQFNGAGEAPTGSLYVPNAITVDNDKGSPSYGDVYVANTADAVIDKFEPEGKYLNQLTGTCAAPDESQTAGVCEPSAAAVAPFGELRGVAVDPSGNLWVNSEFGPLDEFSGAVENEFLVSEAAEGEFTPGIAVDSKDNVYLVLGFFHNVERFATGKGVEFFAGGTAGCGCVTGVAVDQTAGPAQDSVYVGQGTSVAQYPPDPAEGSEPEVFGSGALAEGSGLAVSATHAVYVADAKANDVVLFEQGSKPAQAALEQAGTVEGLAATLEGKLEGGESAYHFAYNTNGSCKGAGTTVTPTLAATGTEKVSARITGLTARTQYTFCLIEENHYGQEPGQAVTFETKPSVPLVEAAGASVRQQIAAALEGSVNPEREAATCVFQYGTTEAYGHEVPCEEEGGAIGSGSTPVPVSAYLEGLEPDTTYDYRLLASNTTGSQPGANGTFATEVVRPAQLETAPPLEVTPTSAQFAGQVNPGGSASYYIEYGSPECSIDGVPNFAWFLCASKSTEAGPVDGDHAQALAPIEVTGLMPGATYRYWLVAKNANGSAQGQAITFTTPPVPAPVVPNSAPLVLSSPATPTTPAKTLVPSSPPKRKTAAQEKAEKLSKALKQCKKTKNKAKRKACEAQARKRYGAKPKSKPKSSKRGK